MILRPNNNGCQLWLVMAVPDNRDCEGSPNGGCDSVNDGARGSRPKPPAHWSVGPTIACHGVEAIRALTKEKAARQNTSGRLAPARGRSTVGATSGVPRPEDHRIEHELFEGLDTRLLSERSASFVELDEIGAIHSLLADKLAEARVRRPNGPQARLSVRTLGCPRD